MPINNITQTISTIPPAGARGVDVQTIFVIKQEDFQDHLQGITVTELNTLKDQLNTRIGEINSTATTMNGYANTASAGASTATTKAGEASTSAGEALTSRNQASTFATNSSTSATKASQWADNNYNVEVETGKYSAKHWSTVAQNAIANKIDKVASTDNAIVRFDGVTGQVQNSGVIINDSGNVGIGVTPSAWYSNIKVNQIGSQTAIWDDNINGITTISKNACKSGISTYNYIVNDYAQMYRQSTGSHHWYTAPSGTAGNAITWTNTMTLDASGNLLVGLNGGSGVIQASGVIYSWNNVSNFTYISNQTVSSTAQVFVASVGGVTKAAILSNGTYQSATNVYGSTSDIKLKENVVDTTPKLDKLMQVQVRNFNYIGQEDKQIGVIAQEIEQIFPSVVFETKDTKQVEVTKERIIPALEELKDDDGNITQEAKPETIEEYTEIETVETGETTKNVKYSVIYMMMLKGMQEQQEIINDLKSRIEILEGAK